MENSLAGGWTTLWGALNQGEFSKLMLIVTVIGVGLVVYAAGGFLWKKRKGGGGDSKGLWIAVIIGAAMTSPNILIPVVLTILDLLINVIVAFVKTLAG